MQFKVHFSDQVEVFYSVEFKTTQKPSKVAAAKGFSPLCVYVIDATCFDKCFLFHVITRRHCFYNRLSLL